MGNGRLEITGTCLLSMMAFQGSIKDMLPPMPYLTAMGKYVIAVFVVLVFHGFEHAYVYLFTSGTAHGDWRERCPDFFFGAITYWEESDQEPVQLEAGFVVIELGIVIVSHVFFLWFVLRARRLADDRRQREAQNPGVTLVPGPPPWGKPRRGLRRVAATPELGESVKSRRACDKS